MKREHEEAESHKSLYSIICKNISMERYYYVLIPPRVVEKIDARENIKH
jgi:hypothetical protein